MWRLLASTFLLFTQYNYQKLQVVCAQPSKGPAHLSPSKGPSQLRLEDCPVHRFRFERSEGSPGSAVLACALVDGRSLLVEMDGEAGGEATNELHS